MIRVKIVKPHPKYKIGDTVLVSKNEAHGLLDSGAGIKTKDMIAVVDYRVSSTPIKVKRGSTS